MPALAEPFRLAVSAGAHLVAADAAFYGVFGLFVVAFAVLAFVSVRWAVRRDRAARAEWVRRQELGGAHRPALGDDVPGIRPPRPPHTNGHSPRRPGQKGRERNQPG